VWRFAYDGVAELDKIAQYAPGSAVYLRIATKLGQSEVPSEGKFGVDVTAGAALLIAAKERGLRPYGVTFHVGSQMVHPRHGGRPLRNAVCFSGNCKPRASDWKCWMLVVDFRPATTESIPPIEVFANAIHAAVARELPYPVRLVAEPGRALVAEAGVMVTNIIGTADRRGIHWIHLDIGAFNGMMESLETGNHLHYPLTDSRNTSEKWRYNVTGPTCDSQDTLFFNVQLSADLQLGDQVFIHSAGAYTTAYASGFNGFEIPTVRYTSAASSIDTAVVANTALTAGTETADTELMCATG